MIAGTVLKGIGGAGTWRSTAAFDAGPSPGAAARTSRLCLEADLANFDPIWGTQYVVRNAAALVWTPLWYR